MTLRLTYSTNTSYTVVYQVKSFITVPDGSLIVWVISGESYTYPKPMFMSVTMGV